MVMGKRAHFSSSRCSLYLSKHRMTSGQKLLWCSECEVRGDSVISHSRADISCSYLQVAEEVRSWKLCS